MNNVAACADMLVRREVDRQLRRHRNPKATTVLWVGVSHTGLGILVPLQPYIGIPLLIAESFTRMFYHVLHVAHTAGIIYNLEVLCFEALAEAYARNLHDKGWPLAAPMAHT